MADVKVKFSADTAGVQKGINSVKGAVRGLAATVGTILAPIAALVSVGAALGAVFKGVSLAAELEATETSFATLLGSMNDAKGLLADIAQEAKSTPYGFTELASSARKLLAVTDKENVTAKLRQIGDLASASQKPIEELASMYAKIKGGDIVQGEDLNQIGDALGGKALQEFVKVLGVDSVKAVRNLGSEGKISGAILDQVFSNLTSKGGMAFGAMEAQSRTFLGLISTLKDNWQNLLRVMGRPILDALKPLLSSSITLLESLEDKARAVGEAIGKSISFVINAFEGGQILNVFKLGLEIAAKSFVNLILAGLSGVSSVLVSVFAALKSLWSDIFSDANFWNGLAVKFESVMWKVGELLNSFLPEVVGGQNETTQRGYAAMSKRRALEASSHFDKVNTSEGGKRFEAALAAIPQAFTKGFLERIKTLDISRASEELRKLMRQLVPTAAAMSEQEQAAASRTNSFEKAKAPATVERFQPILSSLARIGGASAVTSNPLVSLQTKANNYLEKITRNTSRASVATYA